MVWQDIAIAVDAFILAISIVPIMMNRKSKVPIIASLPTAVGLAIMTVLFLTLDLFISASAVGIESAMWVFILFRRRLTGENESQPVSEIKNREAQKVDIELPMHPDGRCANPECDC